MFYHLTNFIQIYLKNHILNSNAKEIANIITTDLMGLIDTQRKT